MILWTIFLWSYNGIRSYSLLIIFLIISLLIIYCITGNFYLSVLFNYFTHPQPLLLAQPICSMYLRVCFHFVCWFVLFVLDSTRNQEHVFVFHCLELRMSFLKETLKMMSSHTSPNRKPILDTDVDLKKQLYISCDK